MKVIKQISVAVAVVAILGVSGCVSTGNTVMKTQTADTIANAIVNGKTTKQQVTSLFGSADSVSFTDSGNEVWTYRHSKSKPMARNFIPYVGLFSSGTNIQTKELVILFDKNGVVTNHTFRETANQSKAGILE